MSQLLDSSDAVRAAVREHYAEAVTSKSCCGGSTGCCSDDSVGADGIALYDSADLVGAPEDAISFGCGNPTALAGLQPGEIVLDLGSGSGLDAFIAARKVGPQGFVHGVDMTDEMLELARSNAAKHGIANVAFHRGTIEALPLDDNTVDVIISNCVINLSPDKGQTLHEAFRVLRPGGRLLVSDIVVDGRLDDLPVDEATIRAALSWAGCVAGALTADEYRRLLAEAGFEQIAVDVQHRYTLSEIDADPESINLPVEVGKELVRRFTSSAVSAVKPR